MSIDVKRRIQRLEQRRRGEGVTAADILYPKLGKYRSRSNTETIQYALGAMEELDPEYTATCVAEGKRVINQLETRLQAAGTPVACEFQGSVPLNIHIRTVSDIDILALAKEFLVYDKSGPSASAYTPRNVSTLDDLIILRRNSEIALSDAFPGATVDINGAKSIKLSGGSLRRKVDVVPSSWYDSADYQVRKYKELRDVNILDKDNQQILTNKPFLYIAKINEKDDETNGGAKKVIRLLKTLRSDAEPEINLSSYDIASLVWHIQNADLNAPWNREIGFIAEALRYLHFWSLNREAVEKLDTPDGTRKIIDEAEKFEALQRLTMELYELALVVAGELAPGIGAANYGDVLRAANV